MTAAPGHTETRGSHRSLRSFRFIVVAVVTLGVILRLWHWANSRSLWIDEARLALNIAGRSFRALADPLWFDQSAPLLFLWITKFVTMVFGVSEESVRLIPTLAGIAAIPLMFATARLLIGERSALYATALLAVSPIVLYFSNEAKPYSTDLLVSAGLQLVTLRALTDRSDRNRFWLSIAGIVAPWVSLGAFFVLPACYIATALTGEIRTRFRQLGAIGTLWFLSCFGAYSLTYAPAASNAYLYEFWGHRLMVPGPGFFARVWQAACEIFSGSSIGIVALPGTPGLLVSVATILATGLAIIGSREMVKRSAAYAALILLPLSLLAIASLVGRYPLALRLAFFALPSLYILYSAGALRVLEMVERSVRVNLASAFLILLLVVPVGRSLSHAVRPERWGPIAEAVERVRRQAKPDDVIYIGAGALPAWAFYTTDWQDPEQSALQSYAKAGSSGGYAFENQSPTYESGVTQERASVGGRREIWGRPTGMQWLWGIGFVRAVPIDGWAESEAERIRATASRFAWVFMAHAYGAEHHLDVAIRECGGQLIQAEYEGALRKYAFEESRSAACRKDVGSDSARPATTFSGTHL